MQNKLTFREVTYSNLNSRQKENYNYHKVSAILADFGYSTIRLNDDWNGADFIAKHIDGDNYLKVQLKGRLTFDKKYVGKNIYICFADGRNWYLFPHDNVLKKIKPRIKNSISWKKQNGYSFPSLSKDIKLIMNQYRIPYPAAKSL